MGNGPRAFCAEGTVKTLIYICIRTVGGRTKNTFRKELLLKGKREMIINFGRREVWRAINIIT
jgi:hypothetical protein